MTPQSKLQKYLSERRAIREKATAGEWAYGDWSGQCHLKHEHDRGKCKYDHTLHEGRGTNLVLKNEPITLVVSTSEYGELSPNNAAHIADAHNHQARMESIIEELVGALEAEQTWHEMNGNRFGIISGALARAASIAEGK